MCDTDGRATHDEALRAVQVLLSYIGDDPSRPGLRDTPERFLRAWRDWWGKGYGELPASYVRVFPHEGATYNQMIFCGDISFVSHCEHHLAPFFGVAHEAYLADPSGPGLLGLSKLARIVDHFARRLQVQERLTEQVADALSSAIAPANDTPSVGIQMRALHLCMVSRGVQQPSAITTTTSLRGKFLHDPTTHDEFLAHCAQARGSVLK